MKSKINKIILFTVSIIITSTIHAECIEDRYGDIYCGKGKCRLNNRGEVLCSKYLHGDAIRDRHGNILCGKGQCLSGEAFNEYYCSVIEGGGAAKNRLGVVKCYGGCEKASPLLCESEKAK